MPAPAAPPPAPRAARRPCLGGSAAGERRDAFLGHRGAVPVLFIRRRGRTAGCSAAKGGRAGVVAGRPAPRVSARRRGSARGVDPQRRRTGVRQLDATELAGSAPAWAPRAASWRTLGSVRSAHDPRGRRRRAPRPGADHRARGPARPVVVGQGRDRVRRRDADRPGRVHDPGARRDTAAADLQAGRRHRSGVVAARGPGRVRARDRRSLGDEPVRPPGPEGRPHARRDRAGHRVVAGRLAAACSAAEAGRRQIWRSSSTARGCARSASASNGEDPSWPAWHGSR